MSQVGSWNAEEVLHSSTLHFSSMVSLLPIEAIWLLLVVGATTQGTAEVMEMVCCVVRDVLCLFLGYRHGLVFALEILDGKGGRIRKGRTKKVQPGRRVSQVEIA